MIKKIHDDGILSKDQMRAELAKVGFKKGRWVENEDGACARYAHGNGHFDEGRAYWELGQIQLRMAYPRLTFGD